jgi:Na+/phosphate symporter
MVIFAGLVVLFLQRSAAHEPVDHMYQYAPPAIGCAVANYFGNQGEKLGNTGLIVIGWALIIGVVAYTLYVLKPFRRTPQP